MPKFNPGMFLATPGAMKAAEASGDNLLAFFLRHLQGDWGELDADDKRANDEALESGARLLSAYRLKDGTKLWIITEAESDGGIREATTVLLPSEY